MTPEQIQQKIFYGYAKCGIKLGASFSLYRSAVPINPIAVGNLIGTVQMTTSVSWDYMKAQSYGKAEMNACLDAQRSSSPLNCRPGDYLVPTTGSDGFVSDNHTYYVQSLQFDLPPRVVKCNRIISVIRPSQTTGAGYVGYAAYTPGTSTTIMTAMPASVLKGSKGKYAPSKLPTDTLQPMWQVLIPNLGGVEVRVDDIIIDDMQEDYIVTANELTELGWQIEAMQVLNMR